MDVLVLNTDFETIGIIDYYISLIWTERYAGAGDFELYLKSDSSIFDIIQQGYYLYLKDAEMTMIVEQIEIKTNVEDGNEMTITGRSLESILDRRIIWPQTNIDGKLQNGVKRLIDENLIEPEDETRKIDNFIFTESIDPKVTDLRLEAQYTGDNLYDTIVAICTANNLGFKVLLTDDNKFEFLLYSGEDRSYDQEELTYVVFSSKYNNLITSNYLESNKALKTVTIVAGEGEGSERKSAVVTCESGAGQGLGRRELFTDARDISSTTNSTEMSPEAYQAKLEQRGLEKLAETTAVVTFEGQVENGQTFTFGEDYYVGDVVQIIDEYNREGTVRVTELVRSISTSGTEFYPTFVSTFKATINIKGNANDTVKIQGKGFGYSVLLDETGETSIVVTQTGDYTITAKLTGIEHKVVVSTNTTSYSVDLTFAAVVTVTANPGAVITLTSQTDETVVYSGNADNNGIISFNVYRIGLYDIVSSEGPVDEDDNTVELSKIPESKNVVDADFSGNTYNVNSVYLGAISSISNSTPESGSTSLYIYWEEPEYLYEAMYLEASDVEQIAEMGDGEMVAEGPGELVKISEYTGEKTAFLLEGFEYDITYYFAGWSYLTINDARYYGTKRTTSHTFNKPSSS